MFFIWSFSINLEIHFLLQHVIKTSVITPDGRSCRWQTKGVSEIHFKMRRVTLDVVQGQIEQEHILWYPNSTNSLFFGLILKMLLERMSPLYELFTLNICLYVQICPLIHSNVKNIYLRIAYRDSSDKKI